MYQDLLDRLAALPGTEGVAMVDNLPLGQGTTTYQWPDIEGRPTALQATANTRRVTRDYFGVMGIPMLRGRAFTEDEERDGTRGVIVNDELARQGWPGEDPIGKRITFGAIRSAQVVGVVASVQHLSLDARPELQMYVPGVSRSPSSAVVIRTKGDPLAIARDVRAVVAEVDVNLPVTRLRTFEDVVSASAATPRFRTSVLAIFAGLALLLAVAGIYGVLSYLVALRTREIGVRMALGASAGAVVRMVMRQALPLVLLGAVLGSGGAFILGRTLRAFLYGTEPTDTVSLAVSVSLIVGAAFVACAVPARRASRVDPVVALRVD
jgi:putative ABC transport system permease protein